MIKLLFFTSSLFFAQMLAAVHGAEHSFEEHEHDGHVCQIYLYSQQTDHQTADAIISKEQPEFSARACPPMCPAENIRTFNNLGIRAPPSFS